VDIEKYIIKNIFKKESNMKNLNLNPYDIEAVNKKILNNKENNNE